MKNKPSSVLDCSEIVSGAPELSKQQKFYSSLTVQRFLTRLLKVGKNTCMNEKNKFYVVVYADVNYSRIYYLLRWSIRFTLRKKNYITRKVIKL